MVGRASAARCFFEVCPLNMNDSDWKWTEHTTVAPFSYKMIMVASVNILYIVIVQYVSNYVLYFCKGWVNVFECVVTTKVFRIIYNLEMYYYYTNFRIIYYSNLLLI